MSSDCCCEGGRCQPSDDSQLSRRRFVQIAAVGPIAAALAGELAWLKGAGGAATTLPASSGTPGQYPMTRPRLYEGANLEAVAMPIGGIGTGSIWLDGQGRLAVWQILNNLSEIRIPDSLFAVRARSAGGQPLVRVLQTVGEAGLTPVQSISYEGGYPIARLSFRDPSLPVEVRMEAFNPMIPTDAASSSIPCAIFRLTARNGGDAPAEVAFFASLQNAVGSRGAAGIQGVKLAEYGGNRNSVVRDKRSVTIAMDRALDPVASGPLKVRKASGEEVSGPQMFWLSGASTLSGQVADSMARVAEEGGVVLAAGLTAEFFRTIATFRRDQPAPAGAVTIFEDFEKGTYEGWTITGNAFGRGPSRGTEANQQSVSGFAGKGLVNTFRGGDARQGTATSKPFRIEKRYIGLLIGGGKHPGETCVNLRVGDKVVRTATAQDKETLEPVSWDVADLKGSEAVIEIVDSQTGSWGHINVDQIVFSDVPPEPYLRKGSAAEGVARALGLAFKSIENATLPPGATPAIEPGGLTVLRRLGGPWSVTQFAKLDGFTEGNGYRALVSTPDGNPLIIQGPLGKGRVILALAPDLPWSWGALLLAASRPEALKADEQIVPGHEGWGTMALAADEPQTAALPGWSSAEAIQAFLLNAPATDKPVDSSVSPSGQTLNSALAVPFTLAPGEQRTVSFIISWHFPNVQRFQHAGNLYSRRWPDASAVAGFVQESLTSLWQRTQLYHQTVYESNLPEEFLDAMTSQSVILRSPTCFWSEDGYFGGFEGSYGCCPLNCTHVWNYAQSHARLFPEIGRNMRISDFVTFLHPTGETSHRQHAPNNAFIDGHCASIEAAYREHQLSPDGAFLEKVWPGVKKAVDWLIEAIDKDHDGVPTGQQWNTYDIAVSGASTFIGSQYLSALAAAERMASVMNDSDSAARWRAVREAGMANQNAKLWSGQYYFQIPGTPPARDYNNGCHADQLLGQWWAHMLDLGYLYPKQRVAGALEQVMRHNFREKFAGFRQAPRRYVADDEGGLLMCAWPGNDRPKPFIEYADEVWTGIEYAVAGAMVYEGMIESARKIVKTARGRYDGRRRNGLNSGPGGNPFNELECGKFYARAMSSWSLLIASQGLILDGPKGILGFKPRWQPEDHRSFFTAAEGWGLFIQQRQGNRQTVRIEVRHGRVRMKELVFELPRDVAATATLQLAAQEVRVELRREGAEARLVLGAEFVVVEGQAIEAAVTW